MSSRQWVKTIGIYTVIIPSCWREAEAFIANISLAVNGEVVHTQDRVVVKTGSIEYPKYVPFKRIGKKVTFAEFDEFLRCHLSDIRKMILDLVGPRNETIL